MSPDLPPPPRSTSGPCPTKSAWQQRPAAQVDLVVIHCTELPDLAIAREYGERALYDSGTGNSGHYYIDRDGSVHLFVRPTRIAQPYAAATTRARSASSW